METETSSSAKFEMLLSSAELNELFKALALAQSEMRPAVMDMKNPHYNSKYASLTACQDAYRVPLSKNGLSIIQQIFSSQEGSAYYIRSTLGHVSGQWISNVFKLLVNKNDMQGLGSAITYGRRYGVNALVGIVDTEDDDGNAASKGAQDDEKQKAAALAVAQRQKAQADAAKAKAPANKPESQPAAKPPAPGQVSELQLKRLFTIAHANDWTNVQLKAYIKAVWKIESTKDLDRHGYDILIKVIEAASYEMAMSELE